MTCILTLFQQTLNNLKVTNSEVIAGRRREITKALNKAFRDSESETANSLMVGSYGRRTAINGISDLDMLYILPGSRWNDYHKEDGTYAALKATKEAIAQHYSRTDIRVDRLVVVVKFDDFKFEVQPVFEAGDGSFTYPDTYSDSWKTTNPRAEIEEMWRVNDDTGGNARTICRLARAWKKKHAAPMNGLLIDTLAARFLEQSTDYEDTTALPDHMMRDFFEYLSRLPRQPVFAALGSKQTVKVKQNFQAKAKRAAELCQKAIDAEEDSPAKKWRKVFGRFVPLSTDGRAAEDEEYKDTEEFIEDLYSINIKYQLQIECRVTQDGFRPMFLSRMLQDRTILLPHKKLDFWIKATDVPEPFDVRWKVLNRGLEAQRRNMIRGQIVKGNENNPHQHIEHTHFKGDHYVECYLIQNNVVVARDQLRVPIRYRN